MRIGFFTDLHARSDTPEGRADDFRVAILAKLEAIGQIFKEEKVTDLIFGGDLFHTPDPANSLVNDVAWRLRAWDLPIFTVIGSHDYFGYQPKTLRRTAVGIFNTVELLQILPFDVPLLIAREGERLWLAATHHRYTLLDDLLNFFVAKPDDLPLVQVVHGDLVDKPVPWPHVLIQDVVTGADLVLSGHVHSGYAKPICQPRPDGVNKSVSFFNPGSIGRLENTGRQRIPRVVIFDVVNGAIENLRTREVPCEPHPFRERAEAPEENTMQDVTRLIQLIEAAEIDTVDVKAQLQLIGQSQGKSTQVIERAFQLMEGK